jgi:hypothetical protein
MLVCWSTPAILVGLKHLSLSRKGEGWSTPAIPVGECHSRWDVTLNGEDVGGKAAGGFDYLLRVGIYE